MIMLYHQNNMKTMMVKNGLRWGAFLAALLILGFSTNIVLLTRQANAGTGTMYLTGTSSVAHGGTVTLNLRINPGTAVTVVQSNIIYDATKLQYVGINTANSAFDTNINQSQSSGSIQIDRAKLSSAGVTTDSLIASITFTALPYSGSTNVSLGASSNAAYDGAYTNPALAGATVNFTPGSCPAGQTGTPPNCTTPPASGGKTGGTSSTPNKTGSTSSSSSTPSTPNATSNPTPTPSQPAASSTLTKPAIAKTDFQYTQATITATTNVAAQVQLKYGLSADKLSFQTAPSQPGTTHTINVTENLPIATTVYYQLVATDGKTTQTSAVQNAKTKGLVANILLLDKNRKPITGQTVFIGGEKKTSSKDGYVTFDTLTPGEHKIELASGNNKHTQSFVILANIVTEKGRQSTPQQNIFVVYRDYTPWSLLNQWPWITGGTLLAGAGATAYVWRQRNGGIWSRRVAAVPIEGLITSGQTSVQPIQKTPFDEQAYNPFAPNNTPPGPGK
jgi:hypothetical protein